MSAPGPAIARMPAVAMFVGVLLILIGVYRDAGSAPTNELLINIGIATNQFMLILATSNLAERNRETRETIGEAREFARLNHELQVETRAEIAAAAARSEDLSRELARTARGSETRAEHAAAEITITKDRAEKALAEIVILGNAVRDEMRLFHGEWARLDEAQREMGLAILRERPLDDPDPRDLR